jgi:hypothetical protein
VEFSYGNKRANCLLRLFSKPLHEFGEQRLVVTCFSGQEMIGAHPSGAQDEEAMLAVLGGIDPGVFEQWRDSG